MLQIKNNPRKIVGGGQNSGHVYNLLQRGGYNVAPSCMKGGVKLDRLTRDDRCE